MTENKTRAGRPRSRRLTWRLIGFAALFLGIWLVGLLWFAKDLPVSVAAPARATDAIVVLTGGSRRVHQGLELLAQRRAKKLFISGVYRGVDVRELLSVSQQSPADLDCCIALGYEADSTRGNARETADWMREQGLGSLRLVTAAYHMPRSLLEFRRAMPEIEIVPHPVFPEHVKQRDWWRWPGSASLIISEYNKYLVALARGLLGGMG
ncbi:MAG: YdcF family protein [Proteobacteria bacterium]|nr:YdcF family protein [Pseudomonadota bacterium]